MVFYSIWIPQLLSSPSPGIYGQKHYILNHPSVLNVLVFLNNYFTEAKVQYEMPTISYIKGKQY